MNVPQNFELGGLTIDVVEDNTLVATSGFIGQAIYQYQQIKLDKSASPTESIEQAFLHELTHWILYMMNEEDLRSNEKFVDLFAHFMYQSLKTSGFKIASA